MFGVVFSRGGVCVEFPGSLRLLQPQRRRVAPALGSLLRLVTERVPTSTPSLLRVSVCVLHLLLDLVVSNFSLLTPFWPHNLYSEHHMDLSFLPQLSNVFSL